MTPTPSSFARRISAAVRTGAIKAALSANQRFHCAILRIVSTNPSQIEHVQFAAVDPPRRMSANNARLHFEMTRPSMTVSESCRRLMLLSWSISRTMRRLTTQLVAAPARQSI
jgi:hypothetical protein